MIYAIRTRVYRDIILRFTPVGGTICSKHLYALHRVARKPHTRTVGSKAWFLSTGRQVAFKLRKQTFPDTSFLRVSGTAQTTFHMARKLIKEIVKSLTIFIRKNIIETIRVFRILFNFPPSIPTNLITTAVPYFISVLMPVSLTRLWIKWVGHELHTHGF